MNLIALHNIFSNVCSVLVSLCFVILVVVSFKEYTLFIHDSFQIDEVVITYING